MGSKYLVQCPICVAYIVTGTAEAVISGLDPDQKLWIAGRVRRNLVATNQPVTLTSEWLDTFSGPELFSVAAKQEALLLDLARQSNHPGATVNLSSLDCVVVDASPGDELGFHIQSLVDRGLARTRLSIMEVVLTPDGWERVDLLRNPRSGNRSDIFVAMSFADDLFKAWDAGIKPAVIAAGFKPKRVDSDAHNDKIDDRIIAGIRMSYAVVVDVTTQNRGAYFEAGFALGLGRPVVWTVQRNDLENLHFDTRQFSHVVWDDEADLKGKLTDHLLAVFGPGPLATA